MKKKSAVIGLILWWGFIFTLTSLPGTSLPKNSMIGIDKLVHLVMYGGLSFFLTIVLSNRGLRDLKLLASVILITLAYSYFDEWHQPFVGRTFSYYDIIANMVGVLMTSVPLTLYYFRKRIKLCAS